jgi:hypothetical protein
MRVGGLNAVAAARCIYGADSQRKIIFPPTVREFERAQTVEKASGGREPASEEGGANRPSTNVVSCGGSDAFNSWIAQMTYDERRSSQTVFISLHTFRHD